MKLTLKEINTGETTVFELGDLIANGDMVSSDRVIYIRKEKYHNPKTEVAITDCNTGKQEIFELADLVEYGDVIGSENHIYIRGRRFELRTAKTAGESPKQDSLAKARAAKAAKAKANK
jgi:hypothetical protein